ncbi:MULTISPECIES: spore germination lipoprotein GerD [Cytobacillus]|jgi:spore germination protein D|uniref:spore germination lipoprotein GerD n=1 Tax=Cytobacillus TaxID=2675230 RepID=UPI001C2345ED|nr:MULTISPECIES: spore germination lipoprotein GerD [Cytobacillus]MBY0155686.1 spore gernimation protein GerD [Cytobacillus firmus]MBU8733003.1 spore gernimation protein GerD [Cytobacillus oceanisediminis]MCM3246298.1 spore germination lipoprotein GerD [Cytobacillus oceanisediminis]MCM3532364.1 spore germination lipoprotein GerD [Cytobacillus oceanisediminis]MCS0827305.1 spore germination lipoprotein GerD [Cytobacillus firmus]
MIKKFRLLLPLALVFFISGCGQGETGNGQMDYEQTKKMVVDILKTDEGKKALEELMADEKMQQKMVMDQKVVADTIEKTLTSDKGTEFWKKSFDDPKFAESMAKSMQKENEQLLKDLMKDPEYRGMMIEVLKDPELEKEVTDVLKSKEYREHIQKVMTETFESPLFKAKIQDILLKAAEETKSGQQGGEESGGEGGGQGADQGGGGGGQGGGA